MKPPNQNTCQDEFLVSLKCCCTTKIMVQGSLEVVLKAEGSKEDEEEDDELWFKLTLCLEFKVGWAGTLAI